MKHIVSILSCAIILQLVFGRPVAGATRLPDDIKRDISDLLARIEKAMPEPRDLESAAKRAALGPKVTGDLRELSAHLSQLAAIEPPTLDQRWQQSQCLSFLATLGDADAAATLAKMAGSADTDQAEFAIRAQMVARWCLAISDPAARGKIADEVEKIDRDHPKSLILGELTLGLSNSAPESELCERLTVAALAMDTAKSSAWREEVQKRRAVRMLNENTRLIFAGQTVDGHPFTTAGWTGKVILVDFWATWCGPCVSGLPEIKSIYSSYHAKGFEVLGISSDHSAKALQDFTTAHDMSWPQLFDQAAADRKEHHPLHQGRGIEGIPALLLIDKKGICRWVVGGRNLDDLVGKLLAE